MMPIDSFPNKVGCTVVFIFLAGGGPAGVENLTVLPVDALLTEDPAVLVDLVATGVTVPVVAAPVDISILV